MKMYNSLSSLSLLLLLAPFATASPIEVEKRATGITSNEFTQGGCKNIIFIFARGSTEPGNMGIVVGPQTSDGLKAAFGAANVATEGVEYGALLTTNFIPGGCSPTDAANMAALIQKAATQCPTSQIVVAGYSQGAAMVHRSVEQLPDATKSRIAGIVTYGDTQNKQDKGVVPTYPPQKLKVICNKGDAVCQGTLVILPPHLEYGVRAPEGVAFLTQMLGSPGAIGSKS